MAMIHEGARLIAWLRDRAYDTVFHAGDTALQFIADLIRGSDSPRRDAYEKRQADMQERKRPASSLKASPQTSPSIIIHAKQGKKPETRHKGKAVKPVTRQRKRRR